MDSSSPIFIFGVVNAGCVTDKMETLVVCLQVYDFVHL